MPKFYTSYYANIKNIPEDWFLISISGAISEDIRTSVDVQDKRMAPSWSIYSEYKKGYDELLYVKRFKNEIINNINLKNIINEYKEHENIVFYVMKLLLIFVIDILFLKKLET